MGSVKLPDRFGCNFISSLGRVILPLGAAATFLEKPCFLFLTLFVIVTFVTTSEELVELKLSHFLNLVSTHFGKVLASMQVFVFDWSLIETVNFHLID